MEVKPFGIDVSIVEPSGIKTDWGLIAADNLEVSSRGSAYEPSGLKMATMLRKVYTSKLLSPPSSIAKAIVRAVNAWRPRTRYRAGFGACSVIALHAIMPTRWWDSLARQLSR